MDVSLQVYWYSNNLYSLWPSLVNAYTYGLQLNIQCITWRPKLYKSRAFSIRTNVLQDITSSRCSFSFKKLKNSKHFFLSILLLITQPATIWNSFFFFVCYISSGVNFYVVFLFFRRIKALLDKIIIFLYYHYGSVTHEFHGIFIVFSQKNPWKKPWIWNI